MRGERRAYAAKLRAIAGLYASTALGPLQPADRSEPRGLVDPSGSIRELTSDVASPSGARQHVFNARRLDPTDRDRFHPGSAEDPGLSRSTTSSIGKSPLRALRLMRDHKSHAQALDALLPVAGSPLRAMPFLPLSATTESSVRGPAPPADFCNLSTEQGHARRTTTPRTELAISTLSVAVRLAEGLRVARHRTY